MTRRRRYLEGLPLDLPRGRHRLGLDEEGAGVDQLDALHRLAPGPQDPLGLAVPRQLQDGLGVGGGHLQRDGSGWSGQGHIEPIPRRPLFPSVESRSVWLS